MTRRFTQKGFTLIELLIAITLMAVLAGLSWRGIDGLMRTRDVTQTRVNQVAVVQTVLAQWQADLDALQTSGVSVSGLQWDGRVLRMVRRASSWRADGSDPGLWVVGWTRRAIGNADNSSGQWVRWQSPNLQDATQLREAWAQAEQWGQNPSSNQRAWARCRSALSTSKPRHCCHMAPAAKVVTKATVNNAANSAAPCCLVEMTRELFIMIWCC